MDKSLQLINFLLFSCKYVCFGETLVFISTLFPRECYDAMLLFCEYVEGLELPFTKHYSWDSIPTCCGNEEGIALIS